MRCPQPSLVYKCFIIIGFIFPSYSQMDAANLLRMWTKTPTDWMTVLLENQWSTIRRPT